MKSGREEQFARLWQILGPKGIELRVGFKFNSPHSKHEFDFAHLRSKVGIEIEGITRFGRKRSRHQMPTGYHNDCTKYNLAIEIGWVPLRYTQEHMDKDPDHVIQQITKVITCRL